MDVGDGILQVQASFNIGGMVLFFCTYTNFTESSYG